MPWLDATRTCASTKTLWRIQTQSKGACVAGRARGAKLGEPQLTLMLVLRAIMAPWTLQFDRPCLLTSWSASHLDLAVLVEGFRSFSGRRERRDAGQSLPQTTVIHFQSVLVTAGMPIQHLLQ